MIKKPNIFSFFSGAGFLDLGFEKNGYEIVFVNEIHPPFMETYKYSRKVLDMPEPRFGYFQGDIASILNDAPISEKKTISDLVKECKQNVDTIGFIGGPPCPDFSVGGKNRGREGDHGKLSLTYIKLICQQLPDFFVFENVKGLWRTLKHRTFYEELKTKLHSAGYITTEKLINAIEYGVPQYRERIILIGFHKRYLSKIKIKVNNSHVLPEGVFPWDKHIKYPLSQIATYPWPQQSDFVVGKCLNPPDNIPRELTVEFWFNKNRVYEHPNSNQHFQPKAGLVKFEVIREGDDSRKSYKRLHRWRYSPTACYGNNEVHLHPYKARRISVAEALAIQSLPEKFVIPSHISLTNAFKTVGNGVPFLAAKGIAETILDFMGVER